MERLQGKGTSALNIGVLVKSIGYETFVGLDASGNPTRILGVNEARERGIKERIKREAAKKSVVVPTRAPYAQRELKVGLPENAADLEKYIEGVVSGTDHNAALNADDLDLSLLERRLPYKGQRDALGVLRERIASEEKDPGTQPPLTAKEVRDTIGNILSSGVIDELESPRERGVATTFDPEEGATSNATKAAKKKMDLAQERVDAVQREVEQFPNNEATLRKLDAAKKEHLRLSDGYQESLAGEKGKRYSTVRFRRVLERKEAISEEGKDLPVKMDIDNFAEVPLYNLANVHTIMRRMLANTAEGTENSVIVPEGSDVEAVWDKEPKKRGKAPSGIQAGWNYEYLK